MISRRKVIMLAAALAAFAGGCLGTAETPSGMECSPKHGQGSGDRSHRAMPGSPGGRRAARLRLVLRPARWGLTMAPLAYRSLTAMARSRLVADGGVPTWVR
jgi:hypothetical protein